MRVIAWLPVFLLLAGVILVAGAWGPGARQVARADTAAVTITSGGFSPQTITVSPGTTVTWTNSSGQVQKVASGLQSSDPNHFNSSWIYDNQTFSHTFLNAGTFPYFSSTSGFTGTVIVSGGGGGETPTPAPTATPTPGGGGGNAAVTITSTGFSPQAITVAPGTTVTWTNTSGQVQKVASGLQSSDPNHFNSSWIYNNQTFSHTFLNAGTFPYFSSTSGFTGTVIVGDGGGATPTATNTPGPATPTPTPPPGAPATPTSPAGTPTVPGSSTPTPTATATSTPSSPPTPGDPPPDPPNPHGNVSNGGFGPLRAGWNLLIYVGPSTTPGTAILALGNGPAIVYAWDGAAWRRYFNSSAGPSHLNTLTWLSYGQAVWVHVTTPRP